MQYAYDFRHHKSGRSTPGLIPAVAIVAIGALLLLWVYINFFK